MYIYIYINTFTYAANDKRSQTKCQAHFAWYIELPQKIRRVNKISMFIKNEHGECMETVAVTKKQILTFDQQMPTSETQAHQHELGEI